MECKYCKGNCHKAGKQNNGRQRYYCRACKKYQQKDYRYFACKIDVLSMIPRLVCNSVGVRSISRILNIALRTASRLIKMIGSSIQRPPIPTGKKSFELDEIRTYIGNKQNQYWVAYALCSETKKPVDLVVGKRSKDTLRVIVNNLLSSGVAKIKTDKLNIYQALIPANRHVSNVYSINHIERNNLNLRTHLKRLSRKTICFSKNLAMLEACLKIYFRNPN